MSNEEQKNQVPASGQNNESRNRRRRHHHAPKRPDQHESRNESAADPTATPDQAVSDRNGGNKKNRHKQRHKPNRHGKQQGEEHGAGNTSAASSESTGNGQDSVSLEEWRNRIVIRSADGTSPATKPAPDSVQEQPEEPVSISEEELLAPVLEGDSAKNLPEEERLDVIGVQFRKSGKSYYFDPKGKKVHVGDPVVVETARGLEFGEVTARNHAIRKSIVTTPLRPLIRLATDADRAQNAENREKEREAFETCKGKIAERKLPMKLIDVQVAFDHSRILFYFSAESRVDFRELVKDLAGIFHTRIELRQIGIRDEAKLLGGLGACGRPLCCSAFLPDFAQVTIKMAKEQGLSLNSNKISGTCGRLMCCLRYESETYAEELRRMPAMDSTVKTPDGLGTVVGISPIAGILRVSLDSAPDTPAKIYACKDVVPVAKEKAGQSANSRSSAPEKKEN